MKNIRKLFAAAAVLVTTVVSTLLWTGEAADVKAQNTANPSQDTTLQTQAPKQEASKVIERLTEKEAMRDMTDGAKAEMAEVAAAMRTEIIPLSQKITEKDLIARGVSPYDARHVLRSIKTIIRRAGSVRDGDVLVFQDGTLAIKKTGWNRGAAYPLYGEIKESVKVAEVSVTKAEDVKAEKAEEAKAKAEAVKAEKAKKIEEAKKAKEEKIAAKKAAAEKAKAERVEARRKADEADAARKEAMKKTLGDVTAQIVQDYEKGGYQVEMKVLEKNQTVRDLLKRLGVPGRQLKNAMKAFNRAYQASNLLQPGQEFGIARDKTGKFAGLFFIDKKTNEVIKVYEAPDMKAKADRFKGEAKKLEAKVERSLVSGKIGPSTSMVDALRREGLSEANAMSVVKLLAEMDDLRRVVPSDTFEILVERDILKNGGTMNNGRIVDATATIRGKKHRMSLVVFKDGTKLYVNQDGTAIMKPLGAPVREGLKRYSSEFGMREDPITRKVSMHKGLDIAAPEGTPVYAPADGGVSSVDKSEGYGNMLCVKHAPWLETCYAHLSRADVARGQIVMRGQIIGRVGNTGRSTGAHLHFETIDNGMPVNPRGFMQAWELPKEDRPAHLAAKQQYDAEKTALAEAKAQKEEIRKTEGSVFVQAVDYAMSGEIMKAEAADQAREEAVEQIVPSVVSPLDELPATPSEMFRSRVGQAVEEDLSSDVLVVGREAVEREFRRIKEELAKKLPPQTIPSPDLACVRVNRAAPGPAKLAALTFKI